MSREFDVIGVVVDASGKPLSLAESPDSEGAVRYRRSRGAGNARGASNQDVGTPPDFLDAVERRFGPIDFDMAADEKNTKALRFFCDSIGLFWWEYKGLRWCNPPFALAGKFAAAAATTRDCERPTLLLVPYSAGAKWWRTFVAPHAEILSIGRLKFVGHKDYFPRDLALCVYGKGFERGAHKHWEWRNQP